MVFLYHQRHYHHHLLHLLLLVVRHEILAGAPTNLAIQDNTKEQIWSKSLMMLYFFWMKAPVIPTATGTTEHMDVAEMATEMVGQIRLEGNRLARH
jgi:ABC-type Co2+ transport system permease subunit